MINFLQRNKGDFLLHFLQHRSKPLVKSLDQILNSKMDTFQSLRKTLGGVGVSVGWTRGRGMTQPTTNQPYLDFK